MSPEEFRREIREDSLTRDKALYLPELAGDVHVGTSIDGEIFKEISNGRATVQITTPKNPILLLEQRPEIVGYGTNERRAAFGADEGYLVNSFSLEGLELLIEVMITRSLELFARAKNHDSINQFYPYGIFDVHDKRLTGRLLVLKETMPRIEREIKEMSTYFVYHSGRCKGCDIKKEEEARKSAGQTRFIHEDGDVIAFTPFGSHDPHTIRIIPYAHISRLTDSKGDQLRNLARMVYTIIEALPHIVTPRDRFYNTIEFAIHSSPLSAQDIQFPEEVMRKILHPFTNGRDIENLTKFLEKLYHFHVEVGFGEMHPHGSSYKFPFSDMPVIAGRPIAFAERFRNHLNYQP